MEVNKYTESMQKEIDSYKTKKRVDFRLCITSTTKDQNGKLMDIGPTCTFIPDRYDIVSNGEIISMAHIIGTKNGGEPVTEKIKFQATNKWTITLSPSDNPADLKTLKYLLFFPLNASSPFFRNDRDTPLFRIVNADLEESELFDEEDKQRVIANKINDLSETQLRDIYRVYKKTGEDVDSMSSKSLKLRVSNLVKQSGNESLLTNLASEDTTMAINLAKAFDLDLVIVSKNQVQWGITDRGVHICDIPKGMKPLDALKLFINTSKSGKATYDRIINDLKG